MRFVADLHIHSYLSRATSKQLNLEQLHRWAQRKGIAVVATGDFTHPRWFAELRDKLVPAGDGLFALREESARHLREATVTRVAQSDNARRAPPWVTTWRTRRRAPSRRVVVPRRVGFGISSILRMPRHGRIRRDWQPRTRLQ